MRVLSLSHRMTNRLVDNHTIFNAPNIADYDAIVLDVGATFDVVRNAANAQGEYVTHASVPVVNGDSVDGAAGIASVLQRRRDEFARALDHGATVCVFMAPQSRFHGVNGLSGFDRYFFLPAPDGMAWDEQTIRGSEGSIIAVADQDHPFVGVFDVYAKHVLYRATINERAPGVARHGHVLLRAAGGDPVGVDFPVLNGHVVFMPAPRETGAAWLTQPEAAAMLEAMAASLGRRTGDEPRWVTEFAPPGLPALEASVTEARAALEQAREALDAAEAASRNVRVLQDVLWASGDAALLPGVLACARAVGFKTAEAPGGDPVLTSGSDITIQLVAAGSTEAVDMAPHYRLRQRLDHIIEARAIAPRGLIVVNGQRLTHPDERKREYVDALRVASESVGYALVTAPQMFRAAAAALAGVSEDTLDQVRRRLATTNGLVTFDDLFDGAQPQPADASGERQGASEA